MESDVAMDEKDDKEPYSMLFKYTKYFIDLDYVEEEDNDSLCSSFLQTLQL